MTALPDGGVAILDYGSVTIEDGLDRFARTHSGAIGWLLTPFEAVWVRVEGGSLMRAVHSGPARPGSDGGSYEGQVEVDPALVARSFEARLFTPTTEWRWRFDQDAQVGRAFQWGDEVETQSGDWVGTTRGGEVDTKVTRPPIRPWRKLAGAVGQSRCLWGQVAQAGQGWAKLAEARLGWFWVPCADAQPGDTIRLHQNDYLSTDPEHGNVGVADFRFTHLSSDSSSPATTTKGVQS